MSQHRLRDIKDTKSQSYEEMNEEQSPDISYEFQARSSRNLTGSNKKKSIDHLKSIRKFVTRKKLTLSIKARKTIVYGCFVMWVLLFTGLFLYSRKHSHVHKPHPQVEIENSELSSLLDTNTARKNIQLRAITFGLPGPNNFNTSYIHEKNIPRFTLCKLKLQNHCVSSQIVDSIDQLYALTIVYAENQTRHQQLYEYHKNFIKNMHLLGIPTIEFEALYPGQECQITPNFTSKREGVSWKIDDTKKPTRIYMQAEITDYIYHRDNLINVAAKTLIDQWEYLIWVDSHQQFMNPYWWEESIHKMNHYKIIQLFHNISNLKPNNVSVYSKVSGSYLSYLRHTAHDWEWNDRFVWVTGNAWGMRNDMFKQLGFILDTCIADKCELILTWALMPNYDQNIPWYSKNPYFIMLRPYAESTQKFFQNKFSAVRGSLKHFDHYQYYDFEAIRNDLMEKFDVTRDLHKDDYGLLHLKNKTLTKYFLNHALDKIHVDEQAS